MTIFLENFIQNNMVSQDTMHAWEAKHVRIVFLLCNHDFERFNLEIGSVCCSQI